jgi:hypothetical protein
MEKRTLTFERDKTTPNTVRFKEVPPSGQPPVVGSLYVQQWAAGDAQRLTVTIDAE